MFPPELSPPLDDDEDCDDDESPFPFESDARITVVVLARFNKGFWNVEPTVVVPLLATALGARVVLLSIKVERDPARACR